MDGLVKVVMKQGVKLDAHCTAPLYIAHPSDPNGVNARMREFVRSNSEEDCSMPAPKEGTIFFKGKVSGKWALMFMLILITIGGTFGVMKLIGA